MKIVKIEEYAHDKRITIEGFNNRAILINGILKIDSKDFIKLQELTLEVYYS